MRGALREAAPRVGQDTSASRVKGDVPALLGTSDRAARRVVSALLDRGVLSSESTRAPLFITFPAALAARWMPGLFPEQGVRDND